MKRTTLLSLLTMLLLFVGSNVWAQDEPFYTLWTVSAEGTNHTNYTQYFDDEHDGMTWNAPGNQKVSNDITDRWRIGGKEIENVDRTITAKTPMGSAIDRVVLNHFGTSRSAVTVNSLTLTIASDVNYADIIDEVVLTPEIATGEAGSEEFVPTAESLTEWPVDAYYRLTINLTNTTKNNGGLDIASIQFFAPGGGSTVTVAKPVITPNGGTFTEPQEVTITADAGCTIYYTTDGAEPTSESTEYTAPFTVSENCIVKAIAYDADDNASAIASAEFTFTNPADAIETIAELCAATPASGTEQVLVNFNDWVVTGLRGKNNVNILFTDGNNGILLYQSNHGFNVGDHITGSATINLTTFKGAPEITGLTATTEGVTVTAGEEAAPVASTIANLDNTKQGCVVVLEDLTYSATNQVFTDASGATIAFYDGFSTGFTPEDGKTYDVTGIVLWYDKLQIAPRTANDIVEAGGVVTVAKPVITPDGGTFAEPQTVTLTAGEGCTIYYTTDGTEPTEASTLYEAPFIVSEACTVKAIAYDEDDNASEVAEATFTFSEAISSIALLCDAATDTEQTVPVSINNWAVTGVNGNQVYLSDGTNGIVLYQKNHGFAVGDVLNGTASVTVVNFKKNDFTYPEIMGLAATTEGVTVTNGTEIAPQVVVVSDLATDVINQQGNLIRLEGVTYSDGKFVDEDDNVITPYNTFKISDYPTLVEGQTYNVTGVAVWFGYWEIAPRTADEFELVTNKQMPESSWSVEEETVDLYGTPTAVFTTNSDGVVTYESSDEAVATIDEAGVITLVGRGVTVITANVAESDNFLPDSKSFTLTVTKDGYAQATFKYTDEDILGQGASGGGAGFSATRDDVLTLTFTNAFGNSQHIKVYGNASNDIEYSNVELSVVDGYAISQIVFTITGDQDNRSVWVDQFGAEAAYSEDSLNVTWAGMQNKVVLNNLYNTKTLRPKQARIKTIDVTYIKLNETGKTITIGETGLATFCGAEKCVLSGAEQFAIAGAITGAEGRVLTVDTLTSSIPAEVGVLLMGAPGEYTVYTHPDLVEVVPEVNLLTGVLEDTAAPVGSYVLQEQETVGFFEVVAEDPITVPAGHAYLTIEGATAPAFFFTQEDYETGINKVVAETNDAIYNLAGQRLSKMQKGINIVGGKKVLK